MKNCVGVISRSASGEKSPIAGATLLLAFTLAACLLSPSCSRVGKAPGLQKTSPGEIISTPGEYTTDQDERLKVWIDDDGIVNYELSSAAGQTVAVGNAGGNFSRWYFCRAHDGLLWIYSGDIGTFVVTPSSSIPQTTTAVVGDSELVRKMPDEFFDRLTDRIKAEWAPFRDPQ